MIWIVLFGCLVVSVVGVAVVGNRPTPTSAFRSDEERNLYTQATLLARQEIAEIEWRAGLIEMPDHLKERDDVKRFVPILLQGKGFNVPIMEPDIDPFDGNAIDEYINRKRHDIRYQRTGPYEIQYIHPVVNSAAIGYWKDGDPPTPEPNWIKRKVDPRGSA